MPFRIVDAAADDSPSPHDAAGDSSPQDGAGDSPGPQDAADDNPGPQDAADDSPAPQDAADGGPGEAGARGFLSCTGGLLCGELSCCDSQAVPGGTFPMGRSASGADAYDAGNVDELPEHPTEIASYALDTFEVTVGRFRNYVNAFDGTPPVVGAGAYPLVPNSGWQAIWNPELSRSQAELVGNLKCSSQYQTWTDTPDSNESAAINCVSWYDAFAFCIWDGGRLPTEAEWEYAAAGGDENRLYPWGSADPSVDVTRANSMAGDGGASSPVGSHPTGNGKWGHRDLAGGMFEWNLDGYNAAWYSGGGTNCSNCANLVDDEGRVVRGGSWLTDPQFFRAAARLANLPSDRSENVGFRCAR
jgi:formylglycine-generating enzyme required for sulfatase activity